MTEVTFVFGPATYLVRLRDGEAFFRDAAHLGGPWTNANRVIANKVLKLAFRRRLQEASAQLAK